jgi:hypothetical protein
VRITSAIHAVRERYKLGWSLAGLLMMILGAALPWFAIPLQGERTAWSLPVVLAGIPSASWFSYGAVLTVLCLLGLLAAARSRGRPGAETAAIGAATLVAAVTFLVVTGTANWPLFQQLQDQTAQQSTIFAQFGYRVPAQVPSLMLLIPVTGTWSLLAGALRLGWLCSAAGGFVLLASGASGFASWVLVSRRRWALLALGLLIAGCVGRGAIAEYLAGQGTADAHAGDYQAASSDLAIASRLNPLLSGSLDYDLTLGQTLLANGRTSQPLALLADASARGAAGDLRGQVADLRQALALDPASPVLAQQLDLASQLLALTDLDPGPLQALSDPTPADEYTQGRIRYAAADYAEALTCFRQVLGMTGDANVTSSALTYIALSELKLGQTVQARRDLLRAVSVDTSYNNNLARSLVTGLYISTKTGAA